MWYVQSMTLKCAPSPLPPKHTFALGIVRSKALKRLQQHVLLRLVLVPRQQLAVGLPV